MTPEHFLIGKKVFINPPNAPQGFGSGQAVCLFLMSNRPFFNCEAAFRLGMELNMMTSIAWYFKIVAKNAKMHTRKFIFLADEDLSLKLHVLYQMHQHP